MVKQKFVLYIIMCVFFASIVSAQSYPPSRPTFAVLITIDGLQSEHLSALWSRFEGNGFKKAVNSGFFAQNALFNYVSSSYATDYASIFTGTTPANHGIVSDRIYSVIEDDFVPIILDEKYHGIGANRDCSPKNIAVMNIADCLKLADREAKVFSIGLTPEAAIIMGGHSADGVVWLDDSGQLASSDFYKMLPAWAEKMNMLGIVSNCLQAKWQPMAMLHTYKNPPFFITSDNCFYVPEDTHSRGVARNGATATAMQNFRRTPSANSLIKDLAVKAIRNERLGLGNETDMLCLNFSLMPVNQDFAELNSAEKEDMYMHLDHDLKELFIVIDQNTGLENTVIVITGTQTEKYSPKTLKNNNITVGKFDGKRAMALLNSFLMAKYGQGRWILSFNSHQILLNQPLIEQERVDKEKMCKDITQFLTTLQGVETAYTKEEILSAESCGNNTAARLKNSFYPKFSGDISVVLKTGWTELNIDSQPAQITSVAPDYAPLIIFGANISAQKTQKTVEIIDITPTICRMLQIPLHSCTGKVIEW
ncbi:MAG: alkaline phosphatase family protein [Prevotellaceae bacterium]|jgi:hypothetical protein|nr:alkaline phosphatase family protein [Prevotellaceae bacterium]